MFWYEELVGKPWAAHANPPESFNCGELIRYVHKLRFGINTNPILADGSKIRECVKNMSMPEFYDLVPCDYSVRRPFDIALLMRFVRRDHIAVLVQTPQGLQFLHCVQGAGVILETQFEMETSTGCRFIEWFRHKDVTQEMATCRA